MPSLRLPDLHLSSLIGMGRGKSRSTARSALQRAAKVGVRRATDGGEIPAGGPTSGGQPANATA